MNDDINKIYKKYTLLRSNVSNDIEENKKRYLIKKIRKSRSNKKDFVEIIEYYVFPKWLTELNQDIKVAPCKVNKNLPKDLTPQMYYDLVILGINSIEERPKCAYCGSESSFSLCKGYKSYCKSCNRKEAAKNISKALKGKPLSELNRKHLSEAKKGKKLTEEQRLRRPRGYHFHLSEEAKRKVSLSKSRIHNLKFYKSGTYKSSKCDKMINYMSSYELDFLKICDSSKFIHKVEVPDPIPYEYIGKFHSYYPDFMITLDSGKKVLVEIKPKNLMMNELVLIKRFSAFKWCRKLGIYHITITQDSIYKTNKKFKKVINYNLRIYDLLTIC